MTKKGFVYIWEYLVKTEHLTEFKHLYGPDGDWVKLFKNCKGYVTTNLHQDINNPQRFVTVDLWSSKIDRDNFRIKYSKEFTALDEFCEDFTQNESFLGDFESYT